MMEGDTCFDVLEEWICSGYHSPLKILRLLCLQSLATGGLKSSRYDAFRAQIIQQYGYEWLPTLHRLESMGWIRRKETFYSSSYFANLRKSLILIHPEVNTVEPDDVSYVSSGYAPLTVRLIQSAVQGWKKSSTKEEILKELPGRLLDIQQRRPPMDLTTTLKEQPQLGSSTSANYDNESLGQYAKKLTSNASGGSSSGIQKPILILVFLGGITFMEIAALRYLSKGSSFPYHIIMVTTKVINGNTLLRSLE